MAIIGGGYLKKEKTICYLFLFSGNMARITFLQSTSLISVGISRQSSRAFSFKPLSSLHIRKWKLHMGRWIAWSAGKSFVLNIYVINHGQNSCFESSFCIFSYLNFTDGTMQWYSYKRPVQILEGFLCSC